MSANEPGRERGLHEKLCAVILGEADAAEREEVERALERDPELRAEKARLEATISLVRASLGGEGDALSPEAGASLAAAARVRADRAAPRPWYRTPAFALAASLALLLGGFAAFQALTRERDFVADGAEVASARHAERDAYGLADAPPAAKPAPEDVRREDHPGLQEGEKLLVASIEQAPPEEPEQKDSQLVLGVPVQSAPAPASEPTPFERADALREQGTVLRVSPQSRRALDQEQLNELARLGYGGGGGQAGASKTAARSAAGGPGSPGPATPGGPAGGPAGGPGPGSPGPQGAGPYRGAGDTVPPGGGGVAATSRPSLPASEGTALRMRQSLGEPVLKDEADVTRSDDFWLGRGEAKEHGLDLRSLGYSGEPFAPGLAGDDQDAGRFGERGAAAGESRQRRLHYDDAYARRLVVQLLLECERLPDERPRDMFFRFWGDNPFELARLDALSTFSVDVDTASYALARRYLVDGHLPEKAQVRTEEFLNYFKADVPAPTEETFAIHTELAPSLFGGAADRWMLRVAIRGKEVAREERQPLALTFVVDTSGSMKEGRRLELVKHALRLLLGELDARDAVALVAFANDARLVLPMTSAAHRALIESAIHPLQPNGGTNAEAGLRMGYEQALAALTRGAHNRVVLLSDGVANIGRTDQERLSADVKRHREAGIYLNTIGVGMNNHNDALLEQLADKGDGICNYVDDEREARRALVENFTGAFEPIARDVKVQVEFDPAQVESYRLLGYENRAVADQDFRNDAVDAGEVGAGHQVVALYELVRSSGDTDPARPLATVRLRWKPPHPQGVADAEAEEASEVEHAVRARDAVGAYGQASAGYRRSVLVAQLAEFLRRSVHARGDDPARLLQESAQLAAELKDPEFDEFAAMVAKSQALVTAALARFDNDLDRAVYRLREHCWRRAQLEDLSADLARLRELDAERARLEAELRALLMR